MSLPTSKGPSDFPFKYTGLPNEWGVTQNFGETQSDMDSRPIFNQDQINAILAALVSVAAGDTGAKTIGYTGDASGATVQEALDLIGQAGSGTVPPDNSISTAKLQDDAVTNAKMADDSVGANEIIDDSVGNDAMADDAINTDQIVDDAVTLDKMANESVDSDQLLANAVTGSKIFSNAVSTAKINNLAVTTAKLQNASVTFEKLNADVKREFFNPSGIINGDFQAQQRGNSQTASGILAEDRWNNGRSGSTQVHTIEAFTPGQTEVPGNPEFYSRTVVTSIGGAGNYTHKFQAIANVRSYSGGKATVSFYARADANKNIALELAQSFGSGGSSAITGIESQKIAITTDWARYDTVVDVPSVSGKTIGEGSQLQVLIWFDAGSTFDARTDSLGQQSGTFDLADIQTVPGQIAPDFQRQPFADVLAECQPYYWQGTALGAGNGLRYATAGDSLMAACEAAFPVTMRTTPTVAHSGGAFTNCTHNSILVGTTGIVHRVDVTATGTFRAFNHIYTASAEL